MIQYQTDIYIIRCITNLHAGSGDANYGVIDKLVQRDPITGYPCIYAPSLKGAIREHFTSYADGFASDNERKEFMKYVFGSEKKSVATETGAYRFFSADLLSLPVRSSGAKPFYRVTSKQLLNDFSQKAKALTKTELSLKDDLSNIETSDKSPVVFDGTANIFLEDYEVRANNPQNAAAINASAEKLKDWFGEDLAYTSAEEHFRSFAESLPVIARNHLESGISENLWYEEVVPRETRFYTLISYPEANGHAAKFVLDKQVVQIGANASIGYGLCQFKKLN